MGLFRELKKFGSRNGPVEAEIINTMPKNPYPDTDQDRIEWLKEALHEQGKKILSKEELQQVVRDTMREELSSVGKGTKAVIITLAVIIGSLTVIFGGIKTILGALGFHYTGVLTK